MVTFYDIVKCGKFIDTIKNDKRIGIWGIHQDLNEAHKMIYERVRSKSDFVLGIYYQNWASWIKQICGDVQYEDKPFNEYLYIKLADISDAVLIYAWDYTLFNGQYGWANHNLWPRMLAEYADGAIPPIFLEGEPRRNLYTHFRACQALKIVQNEYIHCDVSGGGKRDAWRWMFKEWQENCYHYTYEMVEPILNEYGNAYSGSRPDNKIKIDIPLLTPSIKTLEQAQLRASPYRLKCHYLFPFHGYLYAKYSYNNHYWVEAIKI
jgi:hypothetical protein